MTMKVMKWNNGNTLEYVSFFFPCLLWNKARKQILYIYWNLIVCETLYYIKYITFCHSSMPESLSWWSKWHNIFPPRVTCILNISFKYVISVTYRTMYKERVFLMSCFKSVIFVIFLHQGEWEVHCQFILFLTIILNYFLFSLSS